MMDLDFDHLGQTNPAHHAHSHAPSPRAMFGPIPGGPSVDPQNASVAVAPPLGGVMEEMQRMLDTAKQYAPGASRPPHTLAPETSTSLSGMLSPLPTDGSGEKDGKTAKAESTTLPSVPSVPSVPSAGGVVRVPEGKQLGDRLFLQTAKVKLMLGCLEALNEASRSHEPRSIAFLPDGVYLTIGVPSEGRVHSLCFPDFFFVRYRCIPKGFRTIIDLHAFIFLLNKICSTYRGRCLEIMDQPDNQLLVHALLDNNKFFDATLNTHYVRTSAQPILQAAYYRYPFILKVSTDLIHNIFKRLQQRQQSEVIVEFNGETGCLEFLSTMEGAPCREGTVIPPDHILQNPFLPPDRKMECRGVPADTHVVYTGSKAVTETPSDAVPERSFLTQPGAAQQLAAFRYRAQFAPRSIWLAVKRNKIQSFIYLYMAPDQPILFQYVLQRSHTDSRRAATYDTWIKAVERAANPHIRMPAGGAAAVTRKMMELAPNLGSTDQTFRIGTLAIQQTTGYTPTAADKLKMMDRSTLDPLNQKNPAPDMPDMPTLERAQVDATDDTAPKVTGQKHDARPKSKSKQGAKQGAKAKSKSKAATADAPGQPKKKRGRPPKRPAEPPTPAPTPTPTAT